MQSKIVTRAAFSVVGLQTVGKGPQNIDFPGLWGQFMARINELPDPRGVCYGVCECAGAEGLRYTAAVEVAASASVPNGMTKIDIPGGSYAVFTHKGPLTTLGETYRYIYETWLPTAEAERADRPEFEYYDDRASDPMSQDCEMDIYIPIK